MNREKFDFQIGTGITSIVMIFVVLWLTAFGVLSYSSAMADSNLNDKNMDNIRAYYSAEAKAQEIIAAIDTILYKYHEGEASLEEISNIKGVIFEGDKVSFSVDMEENRILSVVLQINEEADNRYTIVEYRTELEGGSSAAGEVLPQ